MIEYRQNTINFDSEARTIEGYGAVFNSESADLGFFETIAPSAITEETVRNSDIIATFNHDTDTCLARSRYGEGSLQLSVDEHGLRYRFEVPNTTLGNDLYELMKRGDINSSSFAFTIADGGDVWERRDGNIYRTINKIDRLYDVAIVLTPAYPSATASCRNMPADYEDKIEAVKTVEEELRKQEITEKLDAKRKEFLDNINI